MNTSLSGMVVGIVVIIAIVAGGVWMMTGSGSDERIPGVATVVGCREVRQRKSSRWELEYRMGDYRDFVEVCHQECEETPIGAEHQVGYHFLRGHGFHIDWRYPLK